MEKGVNEVSSIFSVIVAIMVALTGLCGTLPETSKPVTLEAGITVDGDLSALAAAAGEQAGPAFSAVAELLSALTLRFAADRSAASLDVLLNGASAANLAVKAEEDGWAMVSSLFPSTQLTVKNETLASMMEGVKVNNPLASLDQEAIAAAIVGPVTQLIADIQATAGEPETGSWNVGGKDYTTKVTYNITTKELLEKILTTVQTVLKDENVAGLVSSMEGFDPASVEEALTSLREQDEAELPVLSAAEYSNEAGDTCAELILAKDEQSISLLIASAGKVTTVNLAVFDQLAVNLVVDEEAGTLDLNGSFAYQGTALTFTGSVKKTSDDSGDFAFTVSVPAGETPISLGVKGTVSAEAPVFEAAEGAKVVALEDMMKDEEAATAFSNEVQMGAFGLLGSIMQQFPGLAVLMNPGTGTTAPVEDAAVEEAPAEEAPVVEEAPAAEEAPAN